MSDTDYAAFLETISDLVHVDARDVGDIQAAAVAELEARRHTRDVATRAYHDRPLHR